MRRELSYVRDGVLNKGAVDFKIPLSSDLESLHFLWWNGDYTSVVNYKIIVNIRNPDIMFQPSLNISHSGQIPKIPTYWRMSLPCNNIGKYELLIDFFNRKQMEIWFTPYTLERKRNACLSILSCLALTSTNLYF